MTNKKYNIIYADPPWTYQDKNCQGSCAKHYNTMTDSELQSLPIKILLQMIVFYFYGLHIPN